MQKNSIKINFSKFKGKEVAIVKGKIVASGSSSKMVLKMAKKKFPNENTKNITLLSVPKEKIAVYVLMK